MLQAELHGKVSARSSGSDDTRLEDTLTSAVFGALQYLPRSVALKSVLELAFPSHTWSAHDCQSARFHFWPALHDGTEPDLLLEIGGRVIVIEAKYGASFGPNQLEREFLGAQRWAAGHGSTKVLLLAVTKSLAGDPPELTALQNTLPPQSIASHVSWHAIGLELEGAAFETAEAEDLLADVLALMEKRGVRHVYTGIDEEDWWLVCAAQKVARKRLYPQITALARELQQTMVEDGARWGTSEDRVIHYHSMGLNNPASWARSYLQLPLWAVDLPDSGRGPRWWATFHVLFDFLNGDISIGYLTRANTVAQARNSWTPRIPEVLEATRGLESDWLLTTTSGNYAVVTGSHHPSSWAAAELAEHMSKPGFHLALERRLPLQQFTGGQQARQMLLETMKVVREHRVLLPIGADTDDGSTIDPIPADESSPIDELVGDADLVDPGETPDP